MFFLFITLHTKEGHKTTALKMLSNSNKQIYRDSMALRHLAIDRGEALPSNSAAEVTIATSQLEHKPDH
jgi:hypothetical protein